MQISEDTIVYFGGEYIPLKDAKISIMTHAFRYGTAIFEGIRGYYNAQDQQIYLFRGLEHFARLADSAKIMHMELNLSGEQLMEIAIELVRQNNFKEDVYIRPTLYKAGLQIGPALLHNPDELCMVAQPLGDYIDTEQGIAVMVSNWRRIDDNAIPARAKIAGSYVNTALAKTDALLSNFSESILLDDDGHVCEGSAMNLFLVRDGKLITPPVTANILEGITRQTIMHLAAEELKIETLECQVDRTELYTADEMFFCGTGAQVSPITSVDYRLVADGQVGSITRQLRDLYFQVVRGKIPKYASWVTAS